MAKKGLLIFNCLFESNEPFLGEIEKRKLRLVREKKGRIKWRKKQGKKKKKKPQPRGRQNKRNGYDIYINSEKWIKRRKLYYTNNACKCVRCGATEKLELHHITYKTLGHENDKDLAPLCKICHKEYHARYENNDEKGFNQFIKEKQGDSFLLDENS